MECRRSVSPSFSSRRYPRSGSPRSSRERSCARICSCRRTRPATGRSRARRQGTRGRAGKARARQPAALPGRARASAVPRGAPATGVAPATARAPRSPARPTPSRAAHRSAPPALPAGARRAEPPLRARIARRRRRAPAPPQRQGVVERVDRHLGVDGQRLPRVAHERVEPGGVDVERIDDQDVAGRAGPRASLHPGPSGGSIRMSGACYAPARAARRPRPHRSACRPGRPGSDGPGGSRARRAASVRRGRPGHPGRRPATGRANGTAPGDGTQACVRRARRHRRPGYARSTQGLGTSAFCEAGLQPWSS